MYVTFLCHILLNAFLIALLIYSQLVLGEKLLIYGLIVLESTISMASCKMFVAQSQSLHAQHSLLIKAQLVLQRYTISARMLAAKLKLATTYELVNTKRKFTYTMGPVGKISKNSLVKVSFLLKNPNKILIPLHFPFVFTVSYWIQLLSYVHL